MHHHLPVLLRAVQSNAVTAGLAALFASFSDVMSARDGGEPGVERTRSVVAPTALREALAALNAHKFGIGAVLGHDCRGIAVWSFPEPDLTTLPPILN